MSFKNSFILVTSLNSELMTFYDDLHIIHLDYRYLYDIAAWRLLYNPPKSTNLHSLHQGYQVDGRMAQLLQAVPRLFDPWRAIDQGGSSPPTASFRRPRPEGNGTWKSVAVGASQKVDLKILRKKLLSDKHWQTSKESWGHSKIGMRNKRLQSTWGLNEWFEDEWFEGNTGLKVCSDFEVCCQKNRENSALILKQARPILYQFINLNCIFVTPWMKLKHI